MGLRYSDVIVLVSVAAVALAVIGSIFYSAKIEPVKIDAKEFGFALTGERVFYQWYTEDQCTKVRAYMEAQGAEMFCMPVPWKSKQPE